MTHRALRAILIFMILATLPTALSAYTIYLKDGTRITAKEKYRIEGDRAIIVLPGGTTSFLDASEIDLERTENANRGGHGSALVLEDGRFTETPTTQPSQKQRKSLADLITRRGGTSSRSRAPARRPQREEVRGQESGRTEAGYLDFTAMARTPYRNLDISEEIKQVFRAQGLESVQVMQGSEPGRVFLEIATNSEAGVFRGLEAASAALVDLVERFPGEVDLLELLMITSTNERGGQFELTPELAAELNQKSIEVSTFFLHHVQF